MKPMQKLAVIALSAAIASIALTAGVPAQEKKAASDAFPLGKKPEIQVGQTYTVETFDAWELLCIKTAKGPEPCEIGQLVLDGKGTPISDMRVFPLPPGQPAIAAATVIAPLGIDLQRGMLMAIDKNKPKQYPFAVCNNVGCVARIGFTPLELESLRNGTQARISVNIYGRPNNVLDIPVSLKGFAKAYAALQKRLIEERKKATPAKADKKK